MKSYCFCLWYLLVVFFFMAVNPCSVSWDQHAQEVLSFCNWHVRPIVEIALLFWTLLHLFRMQSTVAWVLKVIQVREHFVLFWFWWCGESLRAELHVGAWYVLHKEGLWEEGVKADAPSSVCFALCINFCDITQSPVYIRSVSLQKVEWIKLHVSSAEITLFISYFMTKIYWQLKHFIH